MKNSLKHLIYLQIVASCISYASITKIGPRTFQYIDQNGHEEELSINNIVGIIDSITVLKSTANSQIYFLIGTDNEAFYIYQEKEDPALQSMMNLASKLSQCGCCGPGGIMIGAESSDAVHIPIGEQFFQYEGKTKKTYTVQVSVEKIASENMKLTSVSSEVMDIDVLSSLFQIIEKASF